MPGAEPLHPQSRFCVTKTTVPKHSPSSAKGGYGGAGLFFANLTRRPNTDDVIVMLPPRCCTNTKCGEISRHGERGEVSADSLTFPFLQGLVSSHPLFLSGASLPSFGAGRKKVAVATAKLPPPSAVPKQLLNISIFEHKKTTPKPFGLGASCTSLHFFKPAYSAASSPSTASSAPSAASPSVPSAASSPSAVSSSGSSITASSRTMPQCAL